MASMQIVKVTVDNHRARFTGLMGLSKRFWTNVDVRGPDDCWQWLACKTRYGYGVMRADGKQRLATHILWFLRHGYWPQKSRTANHHCDNPSCLNPKHLYLGTPKSNTRDMMKRNRYVIQRGELCGRAKLTNKEVYTIKRLLVRGGITQKELAFRFGVSKPIISRIKTGKIWRHI